MPIILPEGLTACRLLAAEGIEVLHRPPSNNPVLRVGLLNLMPDMLRTEVQFARLLGATARYVELVLALPASYRLGRAETQFYERWSEASPPDQLDGLIVTGAPLELLSFEDVRYWRELVPIFDWAARNVNSTLYVCWAAFAALYSFHGVRMRVLTRKLSGVFTQQVVKASDSLMVGLPPTFPCPVSRHTHAEADALPWQRGLSNLAQSPVSGLGIIGDVSHGAHYFFNHLEYDADTLRREQLRDHARLTGSAPLLDGSPEDFGAKVEDRTWRRAADMVFANWLASLGRRATSPRRAVPANGNLVRSAL